MGVLVKYLYRLVGHGSPGQVSVWAGCSWESWSSICIGWLVMGVLVKYLYRLVGHGSSDQVSV